MDKKQLMKFLRNENDTVNNLLQIFRIPDSIEDVNYDNCLLTNGKPVTKNSVSASLEELQERLNVMHNKMQSSSKPSKLSEATRKKKELKKLKKNKEFKKILVSAGKSLKNELIKQPTNETKLDNKSIVKPMVPNPIFNEEGKIVFSKFDFAYKKKNSHQNARELLKKLKETDQKIAQLKESGKLQEAAALRNELSWQKAFERIEGRKVKDDPKLLYKAIKNRKSQKKKSKKEWKDRNKKVEQDIAARQRKRQENIAKSIKQKKTKKLKAASKKGRVIPGF